jgi:hypothetical protein
MFVVSFSYFFSVDAPDSNNILFETSHGSYFHLTNRRLPIFIKRSTRQELWSNWSTYVCLNCLVSDLTVNGAVRVMVFNATFNNISVISWRSVLLMEETGDNHRQVATHWHTWSHNFASSTRRLEGIRTHNVSGDKHWLYR